MRRLQLTRLSLTRSTDRGSFVGDRCPECGQGVIGVYTTRREAGKIIRYLSCRECGWKPTDNKIVETDPNFTGDLKGQKRFDFDADSDVRTTS